MLGLMQDAPLTITSILARAERLWPTREVVTGTATGVERATYADLAREVRRQAAALDALGISGDGRVASFAWNTFRHLALYYSVPCTGRVLHTGNIRYFPDQLVYTFNHAEDEAVFVDRSLVSLLAPLLPELTTLKHVVVMEDGASTPLPDDPRVVLYTDVVGAAEADLEGRVTDERQAAGICYTSGTTGHPKGVVYSHRSNWLHALSSLSSGNFGLTDSDRIMPVVPFFHANGWGFAHSPLMGGASLVLPGPRMQPAALVDLMEAERVTVTAGVPTIWMGVAPLLEGRDVASLRKVICGGSAVPASLSETWRAAIGIPITQAWGMTEMSPLGSVCSPRAEVEAMSEEEQIAVRATAGFMAPGVEWRIVDPTTRAEVPWDDEASGELEVRGPWIARQYYKTDEPGEQFSPDGWLRTGDVAAVTPLGYLRIVDRTKDLVKSGGEWISSVAVENAIMAHPAVAEAAVIAMPHPKWGERPLAFAVVRDGHTLTKDELLGFLRERLGGWQVPDDVVFIDEVPKTSVGKFSKRTLREKYAGYTLPTA